MLDTKNENHLEDDVEKIQSENISENQVKVEEKNLSVESSDEKSEEQIVDEKSEEQVVDEKTEGQVEDVKTKEQVVDEIDNQIAESSEKEEEHEEEVAVDLESMSLEKLVLELESLLNGNKIQKINSQVNSIKTVFSSKFAEILAEKKAIFLEEGGESIDFSYTNPFKVKFNSLMNGFKDSRTKYYKDLEKEFSNNLETRFSVIEQLKELIENADSKTMYSQFKGLQDRWKKIGPVPREKYNGTWRTYHHHVERFYDLLHLSNDYRDLDFKQNLEEKTKLVEQVELLTTKTDVNAAFKELQLIHKMWKEDIGPVARDQRDEIWDRFSAATKIIHDKRHEFYRGMKDRYEGNVEKKLIVIAEIEAVDTSKNTNHSDWQSSIKLIERLREEFFKIGKVPKYDSDKIWNKFKDTTKKFNKNKNKFYKNIKGEQQENLEKKLKLIELAATMKESEDWENTTNLMKQIQVDWKKIGHVPRKYSDKIWNDFRNTCNHYFDRFHEYKNSGSREEQLVFDNKKNLLDTIETSLTKELNVDLEMINGFISDWSSYGKVPHGMRHIETKFSKLIDKLYSTLSIDPKELELFKFKNQMDSLVGQNNYRKLDSEQLFIRKKIDELIREKQQLENNISFFANAKSDNPLLKNVQNNILEIENKLTGFKEKLSYLSQLDY
jgi:hypothetical protein